MEALAALGVAGTVVQFVDFSSKLISKGNEYHRSVSGALVEHTELRAIAENMAVLSAGLDKSMNTIRSTKRAIMSPEERSLQNVVEDCRKIALEFIEVLDRFTISGTSQRWKSFRQAFKTMWNKEKIEDTLRKLNMAREQLVINLLVVIR